MIVQTRHGRREVRLFELSSMIPHPGSSDAIYSGSSRHPALAVAAFGAGIQLIAEGIAGLVLRVYEGDGPSRRPIYDDARADLFQRPAEGWSSFEFWSDVVSSMILERGAAIWKVKDGSKVVEWYPIDPCYLQVKREPGDVRRVFARIAGDPVARDVTENVLWVKGWAPAPSATGLSVLEQYQRPLRTAASYEEYRGRYFDNHGMPGIVLEVPGNPSKDQRRQVLQGWMRRYGGPRNAGRPAIVWGGLKVQQLAPTLQEAQAAELADALAREVARMLRIYPADLLHVAAKAGAAGSASSWADAFLRFTLFPRMRRIERAIASDPDLFPASRLQRTLRRYPRFDVAELLRVDIALLGSFVKDLRQAGILTGNDGRGMVGLEPLDGADELQQTPVGGAPNVQPEPSAETEGQDSDVAEDDLEDGAA